MLEHSCYKASGLYYIVEMFLHNLMLDGADLLISNKTEYITQVLSMKLLIYLIVTRFFLLYITAQENSH